MNKYCNNCGKLGHISKNCDKPITSYGVILYYIDENKIPKIIMVNRKDSLCYIEFIRGKYNLNNKKMLQLLLNRISEEEKYNLKNMTFEELWINLWNNDNCKNMREFIKSKKQFETLKIGYTNNENEYYNLDNLINNEIKYMDTEWEFPKGKKKRSETYLEAATRELEEETNIKKEDYDIIRNITYISENFEGENKVNYKNIYYIGKCKNKNNIKINKENKEQINEIKQVKLLTYNESLKKIRDYNYTKIKLIESIFNYISKYNNDYNLKY
jgi:ADP-ribose pyrophosphatase YjhB (NUDIX family)